ncbi:hypothetical protein E6P09_14260 [Haloferax mediterranei ATCC 33500]|uniref:Uncharacterized protein n=1 Tax=Haloferax mediterranei (strain ATCC 33500 / DSM 1411 / JCM 8866 / NBRC 14739 / NCIMB 2177 / R-4) TaxID=523841 RepID=I3R7H4_HALMT|nr:hypothetical protein [Haloferax mediterranei]AFK20184.1 hypothetical protein HFX_2501 [Haloferax mediterranei ATCC 33500]AHZ23561.1 hypothetical protein BM92_13325 [Haloferax mediterranei ATCC 33500]ELZ99736.1 hypothetical protein C439_14319 [Haloferax mediterranei ATCC 33500]MDX5987062.1 hypothetical protein [Haloferax mediterranei ATCC 33500]QCQ76378.1 hypothetical protein E6P09_14260 [Haloferax mediterranei ATCC 33500]
MEKKKDSEVSRRTFSAALGALAGGAYLGHQDADDDDGGEALLSGGGQTNRSIDGGLVENVFVAETDDALGQPPTLPAICITLESGWWVAGTDADIDGQHNMSEAKEFHLGETLDDLEEPDNYPAVGITLDGGVVLDFGGA